MMLAHMLRRHFDLPGVIVVHHVLEDTPTSLRVQIERRCGTHVYFERYTVASPSNFS